MQTQPRRAFALVELLVVVLVIAVLAAILFPLCNQARESARRTACLSNQRQLSVAFLLYLQDYDETFPLATTTGYGNGVLGGWVYYAGFKVDNHTTFDVTRGSVWPYAKNLEAYRCPNDRSGQQLSYSYNVFFQQDWTNLYICPAIIGAELRTPACTVLLAEESHGDFDPPNTDWTDDGHFLPWTNYLTARHSGGGNLSFADGHAKWSPSRLPAYAIGEETAPHKDVCPRWER